jgi:hypothetical protein
MHGGRRHQMVATAARRRRCLSVTGAHSWFGLAGQRRPAPWFYIRSDQGGGYLRTAGGGLVNADGPRDWRSQILICNHTDWNPAHWVFFFNGTQGYMQPSSTGRINANHKGEFTLTQLFLWGTADGAYWMLSYIRNAFVAASLSTTGQPVWATSSQYLGWERWQFHT